MQDQSGGTAGSATIVGSLAHYAACQPDNPAYVDPRGTASYGELFAAARRLAAWLQHAGVQPGDTVALPLDTMPALARPALEMLYAIAYAGATILPFYPEVPLESRLALLARYRAHWLIASGAPPQVAGATVLDPRGAGVQDGAAAVRHDLPQTPSVYLFTSGTTGNPKALLPTHAQLHGNVLSAARAVGTDSADRQLASVAWPSGIGLRYLLRAHAVGAASVSAPFDDTRSGLGAVLERFGVTRIYLSPWQLRRLLQSRAPARPWPALRSIQATGAFVSSEEIAEVRERLSPNFVVSYGCNELGSVTVLGPQDAPASGGVGRLVPGMEVRVDGARGKPLAIGETGELGFRAPWMCTAYVGNPQATQERFRDGWVYPGDIGSVDAAGCLTLRGRTQEVINYGGLKIWPEDVEAMLKQHPDILDAALVGLPDPQAGETPAAFLVPRVPLDGPLPASLTEAELKKFCGTRIDATRVPPLFVAVAHIPRNESGKIMRGALAEAYLEARPALVGGAAKVLRAGTD